MYSNEKWPFGQYPLHENTLQLGKCLTSQGVGLSTGAETSDIPFIVLHIKQPLSTYWLEFERIKPDPGGELSRACAIPASKANAY